MRAGIKCVIHSWAEAANSSCRAQSVLAKKELCAVPCVCSLLEHSSHPPPSPALVSTGNRSTGQHPASSFILSMFNQVLETVRDSCQTQPRPTAPGFFCLRVNCKFHKRFQSVETLLLTWLVSKVMERDGHVGATEKPGHSQSQDLILP